MRPSTFRILITTLGLTGFVGTTSLFSFYWLAFCAGIVCGAGGWLIDYFAVFRLGRGKLALWSFVIGCGIVLAIALVMNATAMASGSPWPIAIQYVAVVLICWALLLYTMPSASMSPNKSLERTRER
jgi:hypothetical protein